MTNKIALGMIVYGDDKEAHKIDRALSSIAPHVDGLFITITGGRKKTKKTQKILKKYNANISYTRAILTVAKKHVKWCKKFFSYEPNMKVGDKIFLFDEARNFNMSQVPKEYDWYFWIDADDVVRRGENLKKLGREMLEKNIESVYMNYLYQVNFEHDGLPIWERPIKSVVIEHIRERLVRNNGHYKWIAPIHETMIEQTATNKTDTQDVDIVHLSTFDDRVHSLTRNLPNLELAIFQSEGKDPRHLYYLAKAYYDLNTPEATERAIPLIKDYLFGENKSGWPQERSQSSTMLAELYLKQGKQDQAIKCGMNALIEDPENPAIFINLATSYAHKRDWNRALFWVRIATKIPEARTTLVKNPLYLQGAVLEIIYNACLNLGQIDEAWAASSKIVELVPDDEQAQRIYEYVSQLKEQKEVTKKIMQLANYLRATGETAKVKALLAATPAISEQTPYIQDLKMKNNPPKYWDDNEIVIYCGPQFTVWSPKSLSNPKEGFVGGSEEAVIRMSGELAKLGWKVTVYADPGEDEGNHDGVRYLPYYKFNPYDHFGIIVSWRNVAFFDGGFNYKKGYVWNHDIINKLDITDERVKRITKYLVLSKWQAQALNHVPTEKIMITSNGI